MRITEENVVEQLILKNEESLTFVLQTYGGLLHAVIRKYLHRNQHDIEECLADVLVSIWFNIQSFDSTKNEFKQWIAAIARYRAIDYLRKSEQERNLVSAVEHNEKIANESSSDSDIYDLEDLIKSLSEVEQHIFRKYYFENMPTSEIATHYNTKQSWVHNKLSRGRKKLKDRLLRRNEG
ncbi:sigma-70 family RNA polymerase sigma factor [Bacillaceae bacterium W0354]